MAKPTPADMLDYVIENNMEGAFLGAIMLHKGGFSIGEVTDARFIDKNDKLRVMSKAYELNVTIEDEEICSAVRSGMYVSVFIARNGGERALHFFVHRMKLEQKSQYEEEAVRAVVQYMIIKTIIALRLDSTEKIDAYIA